MCGACLHFNHLKLVARLPLASKYDADYAKQEKSDKHITPVRRSSVAKYGNPQLPRSAKYVSRNLRLPLERRRLEPWSLMKKLDITC